MKRLTAERVNGIKTGYWSAAKKEELVQRLGAFEDMAEKAKRVLKTNDSAEALLRQLAGMAEEAGQLEEVPSAPVQKVKRGRWVAFGNTGLASCECGYITDRYSVYSYCPKCGAHMEEGSE